MLSSTIKVTNGVETTGVFNTEFNNALFANANMTSCRVYKMVNNVKTLVYDNHNLMSLNIWYEGNILSSIMKNLELEVQGLVSVQGDEFCDVQIGISGDNGITFYYVSYGKFKVKENEQNLENKTTKLTCCDEMANAMVAYTNEITYTDTYTNYNFLTAIATSMNFTLGSSIPQTGVMAITRLNETYTAEYTYRDILDDFSEILGGCLVIKNSKIELLKPTNNAISVTDTQLSTYTIKELFGNVTQLILSRSPQEDNLSYPASPAVGETIILDNNLLVEGHNMDRTPYLAEIYGNINTIGNYNLFELQSFGYLLFEPCDKINFTLQNNGVTMTVTALWTASNFSVTPAISENAETELCPNAQTEYKQVTPETQSEKKTYLYVNKVTGTISSQVEELSNEITNNTELKLLKEKVSTIEQNSDAVSITVSELQKQVNGNESEVTVMKTALSVQTDGVHISQGTEGSYTLITDKGMDIYAEGNRVAYARNDGFYATDYIQNGWHMQTANSNNSFNFIRKDYGK